MSEVWVHPQLEARGRWFDVATPAGPVPALRPPGVDDDAAGSGAVPAVGEHTESILLELGLTRDDIARLRGEGAV